MGMRMTKEMDGIVSDDRERSEGAGQ